MLTALVGRFGFRKTAVRRALGHWNALCAVLLHHILQALVFASQSPYPGLQNVIYLRTLGEIMAEFTGKNKKCHKNPLTNNKIMS
jgi:hypothetical protein